MMDLRATRNADFDPARWDHLYFQNGMPAVEYSPSQMDVQIFLDWDLIVYGTDSANYEDLFLESPVSFGSLLWARPDNAGYYFDFSQNTHRVSLTGGNYRDYLIGGLNTDTLTGSGGLDRFQGTAQTLAGDTITDIQDGESITLLSGTLQSASLNGNVLAYTVDGASYTMLVNGAASRIAVANNTITFDNTAPFVASISRANPSPTATGPISYTVTFSETVTGLDVSDFALVTSGLSGAFISQVTGSGSTYTLVVNAGSGNGTAQLQLIYGNTGISDAAGNLITGGFTGGQVYMVDQLAPDTTITATPPTLSNSSSATFTFSSNESGGRFEWTLDGSAYATATSPKTVTGLADGSHTIFVRAIDQAGNIDGSPATYTWVIDTTAPTLTIASDVETLKAGETAVITFTFSEDPGLTFTLADISVSGGSLGALSGTGLTRTAVFTPGVGFDSGTASITVASGSYADQAGNSGGAGTTPLLTFDTQAPVAPSTPDLDASSDTGRTNDDNITSDTTPTFIGTAEAGTTVSLYDGAVAIGSAVATGGLWSITSTPLAEGPHSITAVATDPAGNHSLASGALALEITTQAPATEVTGVVFSSDTGASVTDRITKVAAQTISGSLSANLAEGERVEVSFDNGSGWTPAAAPAGSAFWSLNTTLAAGTHNLQVRVTNAVDKSGPVHIWDYTLDTHSPGVTIESSASQLHAGETATITFTFTEDPGANFTWDGSAGDVLVSGGTLSAISGTGLTRTAIFMPSAGTQNGTASITVSAGAYADLAGNFGTTGATPSLHFDTLAPGAPSAPALAASSDSGNSSNDNLTNNSALTLTGTAEAGVTIRLYDTDGVTEIGSGIAIGGTWSITTSPLAAGSHTVSAKATDAMGNRSPVSTGLTVVIDVAAPTLVQSSPVDNSGHVVPTADLVLTFSEAVHRGNGTIDLYDSTGALIESFDVATSGRISIAGDVLTVDPTNPLSNGNGHYYLNVSAGALKDAAGNSFAGIGDRTTFNFSVIVDEPSGPVTVPNAKGGVDITITDPSQLTAALGTSGVDHVFYSGPGTVRLPGTIENVTLTGGDGSAMGNTQRNTLRGGSGNNALNGQGGNDLLYGSSGDDRLSGGSGRDRLEGGSGDDLLLAGSGHDTISGSAGNDTISAGAGNDVIYSGLGADVIEDGGGRDAFVFNTRIGKGQADMLKHFNVEPDTIWLENAIFKGVGGRGWLKADAFHIGVKASDKEDRIIYNAKKGMLYYDADGLDGQGQIAFAKLSKHLKITEKDFFII
ncbi:Ig-like domain-containing protein [Microvirga terrestris]|uniref:Ig-like domain-containing protein n=1 Tax=Microvirga terrestris TaxID=2791024 RepID=A0ABS0HW35_9HYPH|nr:Ig-like domain-containing protein [Microvirga terrestris]MBF9197372.1 Ig-like domain-containing protein [Microvirga terrestris]